ncbi:MAG: condensation domain-containing protein, partial [Acidobacteriota bacterium]|nr:condensation domain-containing protein [Acidobacteriota bacterium]
MNDLSRRIESLTPEQRAVFERLRKASRKKRVPAHTPEPIPRRTTEEALPLSFDQERLWFLYQLDPRATAYNIDTVTRMRGPLRLGLLRAALDEILRRHEAWRTTFAAVDGRPVAVIAPRLEVEPVVIDLSALPEAEREPLALHLATEEARQPFDLEKGPLLRLHLLRMSALDHFFLATVHHIVTDWVSFQLFRVELAALYEAFSAGRPSPLPELPIQYADFAIWQREWLSGERLARYLDFWTAELAGMPYVLELPTDRPRPPVQTVRGKAAAVRVPSHSSEAFRGLARRLGATPFMGILAAFAALLCRQSGQERLLIGSPNANRNRVEIEKLFGFFLTQLVFAMDMTEDPSFGVLAARARKTALAAYAHQELPFGKLVEALRPERDASRAPLVQVNLLLLDPEYVDVTLPGLRFTPLKLDRGVARFDLTLGLWDGSDGIAGFFEYNLDLFDPPTVARLVEGFEELIEQVTADPEAPLSALVLLSPGSRHQVLYEWNDTAAARETPETSEPWSTVDAQLEAQALRTPGRAAVVVGELELTHAELNRRANRLAHHLRGLGVGPESRVGLAVERSAELVVGLLGIWKAGGAFVPLDPGYPRERLALLVEDAGIEVVVTQEGTGAALPDEGLRAVCLGGVGVFAGEREGNLEGRRARPTDLAYVLYTSGTTGRPKGVMVEHGNLAAMLRASRLRFAWTAADRMPCLAAFSFDIFLFELLNPLLAGGTAELVPLKPALDPDRLLAALALATRLHAVPALMRQVVELARLEPARYRGVRTLFTGGDAVPPALLEQM